MCTKVERPVLQLVGEERLVEKCGRYRSQEVRQVPQLIGEVRLVEPTVGEVLIHVWPVEPADSGQAGGQVLVERCALQLSG